MSLKLDEMESDLVLACKHRYGDKGVEKVIADYCGYGIEHVNLDAKYYFISELLMKLISNGNLRLAEFIREISPRYIDGIMHMDNTLDVGIKVYNRIFSMIQGLQIKEHDKDGSWYDLVELHELNEKFKEDEEITDSE